MHWNAKNSALLLNPNREAKKNPKFKYGLRSVRSLEKIRIMSGGHVNSAKNATGIPQPGALFMGLSTTRILLDIMNGIGGSQLVKCTCRIMRLILN